MENTFWDRLLNHEDYQIKLFGADLVIKDKVFSPDSELTYTPSIIINNLGDIRDLKVADVGTGTGIIAIICALKGAKLVVATDISEVALANAKENIILNNVDGIVELRKTNLLEGVSEKFDVICANLPILDTVWEKENVQVETTIEAFLKSAKENLKDNGRILIPSGSFAESARTYLEDLLLKHGFKFEVKSEEKLGFIWYLYVIT